MRLISSGDLKLPTQKKNDSHSAVSSPSPVFLISLPDPPCCDSACRNPKFKKINKSIHRMSCGRRDVEEKEVNEKVTRM